jgi:RNA polymerase sigma-70 factor (ECF subfamily)
MMIDQRREGVVPREEDIQFAASIASREPAAVHALFSAYTHGVSRYVMHLVPDLTDSDLEDVVQETFIGVLRSARDYRGDCSLSTFVLRIAHHKAIDVLRRRTTQNKHESTFASLTTPSGEEIEIPDNGASIEDGIIMSQHIAQVRRSLAELPADQRRALMLRYVFGMRVDAVARRMNLSHRMAELLITRGRAALKGRLRDLLDG